VRRRPDIRLVPFEITEFNALGDHATAFSLDLATQEEDASKGMHVGML
jgi:hypothetical protein